MDLIDRYGPWAIVAGASEGSGRAFASPLAASGIHCVLIARRQQPLLELAAEIQRSCAVESLPVSLDLSLPDACERIVALAGLERLLFIDEMSKAIFADHQ